MMNRRTRKGCHLTAKGRNRLLRLKYHHLHRGQLLLLLFHHFLLYGLFRQCEKTGRAKMYPTLFSLSHQLKKLNLSVFHQLCCF
jgi:hypothetical protein